ncbi:MAG: hypothetical protein B9S34_02475 [Opitutia bacterium Tous-C1TDCM]|nr:MAG: hypothetical protein B9S34_02475 [Opitutae bacterium Tous-C1TDCM]
MQEPTINAPRGGLVGATLVANAVIPAALRPPDTTAATYQWTISGARILGDPRAAAIQFVADRAGTVALSVALAANGTTYSPSAQVAVFAPDSAGSLSAPARVATDTATFTASVPAAQNGDRTFRWTVSGDAAIASGQGTASVTLRPGTPGTKAVVCNVTLQNLVTIPVRSFVIVTGNGAPTAVTIANGSGGGTFPAGSRVDIMADPPPAGQVFDRWTGMTEVLGTAPLAALLPQTTFTVPATPVSLTATYKAAPGWTTTSLANFNPQTQTGANNVATTVSSTLTYHVPPGAAGVVFLLHAAGDAGADWFSRPEALRLARDLVAAGYGVAALDSISRTPANWGNQATLTANLDALNHAAAYDRLVASGALAAGRPLFFLGEGAGANAASRIADLIANATPARPVRGTVLYLAPGIEALAVTSRVPQFFALAANDTTLGAAGLTTARDNSQFLLGRGIATGAFANPAAPVWPSRFRGLGLSAADAGAVAAALKAADLLDANDYPRYVPTVAAATALLPASLQPRAADIVAQLAVAAADNELYASAAPRIVGFLNARAANAPVPPPGRLVNLSTRSKIAFVGDSFAVGFSLGGTERATLLIRGIGPALAKFGVADALFAPRLELNQGTRLLASNEGWDRAANAAEIRTAAAGVGAFALAAGDADAALLVQLDPGTYTVTLRGRNGTTGAVLAEVYDVSRNGTRLANLSTLARITDEGELLIPGIVVAGNNPRTLMVRAVGPGLADFGLGAESTLGDPRITVLSGTQTVAANNNWGQAGAAALNAAFPAVGAFPLRNAADSALLDALPPGSYTLQAGATPVANLPVGATAPNIVGSVLVEVYEVP